MDSIEKNDKRKKRKVVFISDITLMSNNKGIYILRKILIFIDMSIQA